MMKNLEYYLSLPYKLEIKPDTNEGGYAARYPELPGCITCTDRLEDVLVCALDAKKAWLEAAIEDGLPIPEPIQESDPGYSGQFKLRMPKSLHYALAAHAKEEGISMNQYCLYLLTKHDTEHEERRYK